MSPAIYFSADAYVLDGPRLMGRQSAGNSFLRAAVRGHAGRPIHAVIPDRQAEQAFGEVVRKMDPQAQPRTLPVHQLAAIAERGLLFRPDINIVAHARERLRLGPGAYSICGLTHTLSSHGPADALTDMLAGPVMPWDAVICTSKAALGVVEGLLEAQDDYLAWRFGGKLAPPRPQLPVIPLGVHGADFAFDPGERAQARAALGLAADEVAVLFAGRLTFNGKAHPFQMYTGLERAARATGRKVALVHAGQFATPVIGEAFRSGVAAWCPSVRSLFVDGADPQGFAAAWRAADIFVSLSDNIQETFGITPLEAMAAGLPVLVSDWDGYKDTVRDGIDGFRVPSWAPAPGVGEAFARDFETGAMNYDYLLSRTSTTTSVEPRAVAERLAALIDSPELRRSLGAAGREHVAAEFDWAVVYRRYEALWRELGEIRARAAANPALRLAAAPRAAPARRDPFATFAHYPTRHIGPATRLRAADGASAQAYATLTAHPMHMFWRAPAELVGRALAACQGQGASVAALARRLGEPELQTIELVGRLAKLELVTLEPGPDEG